jgi:hypothetical protein
LVSEEGVQGMADQERIRAVRGELHEQLEGIEKIDPEVRASLEQVLDELRGVLERSTESQGGGTTEQESVVERLKDAAGQFEESHPVLFGTLGKLMDVLSQMGI